MNKDLVVVYGLPFEIGGKGPALGRRDLKRQLADFELPAVRFYIVCNNAPRGPDVRDHWHECGRLLLTAPCAMLMPRYKLFSQR